MPRGVPRIQLPYPEQPDPLPSPPAPPEPLPPLVPEELLRSSLAAPPPTFQGWLSETGERIEITEASPPWEVDPTYQKHSTDARRFVGVPDTWELRWLSARQLQHDTSRDWMPVKQGDPRVKIKAPTMVTPDGLIRRGGEGGDYLYWMPKHWVQSRLRLKAEKVKRRSQRAVEGMQEAGAKAQRTGYMKIDSMTHPTHTQGDGRSMPKD